MSKVLLFGGAFDPIHVGHEALANLVLDEMHEKQGFEQLWFLPCYSDAFGNKNMQHWKHRVAMLEHTVVYNANPRFSVCTHEIEMANKAGTYAVVKSIMEKYPGHEFAYVIGLDQAYYIRKWRNSRNLLKTIPFVTVSRTPTLGGYWGIQWYRRPPHSYIDKTPIDAPISSTDIRMDIVDANQTWWGGNYPKLNHAVKKYIIENELYK